MAHVARLLPVASSRGGALLLDVPQGSVVAVLADETGMSAALGD